MCEGNCKSNRTALMAVAVAACDLDGPADSSCCPEPETPCGIARAHAAAALVMECDKPPLIVTPSPSPAPGGTVVPTPGQPGSTVCPEGHVWVTASNSLGIPEGCYPNDINVATFNRPQQAQAHVEGEVRRICRASVQRCTTFKIPGKFSPETGTHGNPVLGFSCRYECPR